MTPSFSVPPEATDDSDFIISTPHRLYHFFLLSLFWNQWADDFGVRERLDKTGYEDLLSVDERHVWTVLGTDDGEHLDPGLTEFNLDSYPSVHGYVVTEKPWNDIARQGPVKVFWLNCELCDEDTIADGECEHWDGRGGNWVSVDFPLPQPEVAQHFLASLASDSALGELSASAANTLIATYLIPNKSFTEARELATEVFSRGDGFENWNALSNLGVVEFEAENFGLARDIFEKVMVSGKGPTEEAENYLARIAGRGSGRG